MKVGVLLPTFRDTPHDAFRVAKRAEKSGLDGVFAFDHLWPIGEPERPALAPFPLLASVARLCPTLTVGPLVARVGLVSTEKLLEQFATLEALAPDRVIAALGTGDELSKDENLAYGLVFPPADERRALLSDAARALSPLMEVWCGAGSTATNQVARHLGVTLNLWGVPTAKVSAAAREGAVNWAGPLGRDARVTLDELASAGATWAIASESSRIDELGEWRRDR
ncbi:MAG: flavin-dependent oxidoreductase, F420-dependent methylene-tetrahydromethanopterin reductase [Acidimicrobiaceae bacterium]|nr:flavin-dependent oxidoreductase, F420-dependent methylene-tetrahydromethanopterin reductase [Acidimicrobiaceae bacterium]